MGQRNVNRSNDEYGSYVFYLDGCVIPSLSKEEFFMIGMIYNFTNKGAAHFTFDINKKKGPDAFTKQHCITQGIKKLTRKAREALCDTLIEKEWLHTFSVKSVPRYNNRTFKQEYVEVKETYLTDFALHQIKKAIIDRDSSSKSSSLF